MFSRDTEKPEAARALPEPTDNPALPAPGPNVLPLPQGQLLGPWRGGPLAPPPPPGLTAGPDAMSLLKSLQRRWLLGACLGAATAVVALVAAVLLVPNKVTAFASVQISLIKPNLSGQEKGDYRYDFPTLMKTQAARLKNRDVLLQALNNDQVRGAAMVRRFPDTFSALLWLEEDLKIEVQEGSEFINVTLNGESADEAVALVDAVTKSYLSLVNGKEKNERRERVAKMQGMVQGSKDKLTEKISTRQGLYKGQDAPNSAAMLYKQQGLLQQLREHEKELSRIQFELDKARGKLAAHKASRKPLDISLISDFMLKGDQATDPVIREKTALLSLYQRAIAQMQAEGHLPTESTLVSTQRKYAELKKELDESREALRKEMFERINEKMESDHKLIAGVIAAEIPPLETQYKKLAETVQTLSRDTENIGYSTAKEQLLTVEIVQEEKSLEALQKQLKDLQVEEESDYRVSLGQDAAWQNVSSKKRMVVLLLAPLAALAGSLLGVAWLEFQARRIHSTDEVVAGLGMRLVGSVPVLANPRRQRRLTLQDPLNAAGPQLVESIDSIRTMLLRNAGVEGTRIVMVTSAVAGEGKTTLSGSLALSLARAGRKTLLVDCDLRRPAAHQLFEQTLQPGFSEVLLGEVELPDAVRPTTSDENLWLLPAGQWDREVLQELAKEHPAAIFDRLREEFDFIVVDSHPVLPATDSLLIGQHVDAVILSVMRQVSQAPRVYETCQRLSTLGIRIFGAVVNGMPNEEYGGSYHYKLSASEASAA